METFYTIGEAASLGETTVETLRHYDRIDLLKPAKVDPISNYRYYTEQELTYLKIINFCKIKSMSLKDIKNIFSNDCLEEIIIFLNSKTQEIDNEINTLKITKEKIQELTYFYKKSIF